MTSPADSTAAPSPFIAPGVQYAWDSTSLGLLKECPRKYYYTMVEGWRSRGESVHLRFGIHYHAALEQYDKLRFAGQLHSDALIEVVHTLMRATWENDLPWDSGHNLKTRYTLIRSVVWYLEEFRNDQAETMVLANGQPAVELSFRFAVDDGLMLCGHLDRVVSYLDGIYVMDRKTSSTTLSPHYFEQYSPDNQMSLYTLAGQVVLGSTIRGVIVDAAQIAVGFTRFQRGMVYRTPAQTNEWLDGFYGWVAQAHRYAEQSHWPMNEKSCNNYGGCPFKKICSRDPAVRQAFLETDFEKKAWNPLETR